MCLWDCLLTMGCLLTESKNNNLTIKQWFEMLRGWLSFYFEIHPGEKLFPFTGDLLVMDEKQTFFTRQGNKEWEIKEKGTIEDYYIGILFCDGTFWIWLGILGCDIQWVTPVLHQPAVEDVCSPVNKFNLWLHKKSKVTNKETVSNCNWNTRNPPCWKFCLQILIWCIKTVNQRTGICHHCMKTRYTREAWLGETASHWNVQNIE